MSIIDSLKSVFHRGKVDSDSLLTGPSIIGHSLQIIDNLADLLEKNSSVNDSGLIRLSAIGAKSREELAKAFYIRMANDFEQICKTRDGPTASKMVQDLLKLLSGIMQSSLWGFGAVLPDFELERISVLRQETLEYHSEMIRLFEDLNGELMKGEGLSEAETLDSFVEFLWSLNVNSVIYWPLVFSRIGLHYPSAKNLYVYAATSEGCLYSQYILGLAYGGDAHSQYVLGERFEIDYCESAKWLRMAAEQGHKGAQLKMGVACANGNGVTKDATEAVKWFRKAADQGLALAQMLLATSYMCGDGLPVDEAEALKWYLKAANQGHSGAQFSLGLIYAYGRTIPKNLVLSYMWAQISIANGSVEAAGFLDGVSKKMTPEQIAEAQRFARDWKPS